MKKYLFTLLFASSIAISFAQESEEQTIIAAFDAYKQAVLDGDGVETVAWVAHNTIAYYGDMLELALEADSLQVDSLPLLDKMMVLTVRHRTPKEDLLSFDGEKMIIYAVKAGMLSKNSVATHSIGNVTVEGEQAKGELFIAEQPSTIFMDFYKESDRWKVDLTSLFDISTMVFKKMVEDSGQPENEVILSALGMVSDTRPGPEIWQPIK